jgi:GntR family transcriptional regulator, transcriptional repressor for pyruvate dehydrogenase complex
VSSTQTQLQGKLLKFIRDRQYEQGERLFSEREFAEKFSTTRAAVREAITALEALRIIERRKHSGIYLRDLNADASIDALVLEVNAGIHQSSEQIESAIELRGVLEIGAIRHAAVRRSESDLELLSQILDASENKLLEGDDIRAEDVNFHKAIVGSTGNTLLVRVVNWFYEFSNERRKQYFSDYNFSLISHSEHQQIFEALRQGDPEACAASMRNHLLHTSKVWSVILKNPENRGKS